ncbi:hypothetical protein AX16_006400 [Volvariella volvacea WC 439]|nr:hypothetical protein AX16_006400 [Volvariella volvacea WC 439]
MASTKEMETEPKDQSCEVINKTDASKHLVAALDNNGLISMPSDDMEEPIVDIMDPFTTTTAVVATSTQPPSTTSPTNALEPPQVAPPAQEKPTRPKPRPRRTQPAPLRQKTGEEHVQANTNIPSEPTSTSSTSLDPAAAAATPNLLNSTSGNLVDLPIRPSTTQPNIAAPDNPSSSPINSSTPPNTSSTNADRCCTAEGDLGSGCVNGPNDEALGTSRPPSEPDLSAARPTKRAKLDGTSRPNPRALKAMCKRVWTATHQEGTKDEFEDFFASLTPEIITEIEKEDNRNKAARPAPTKRSTHRR